ncbi:MAG: hypothetical protein WCV55_03650 [Candidatus Paceibacterota bacterium]
MLDQKNQQYADIASLLVKEQFNENIRNIFLTGEFWPKEPLFFDGRTDSGKRFFGHMILAEENALEPIETIEINIGSKSGKFIYISESETANFIAS